jgi:mevalonate kinase
VISARGLGKLILVGEHAVVHGQPALAFAVSLGTTVTVERRPGPLVLRSAIHDALVDRAVRDALGDDGVEVTITTDLPIGRGMGSSAALSVALIRARHADHAIPDAQLFHEALELERVFHANPSGLDVAVSVYGGALRYRRTVPATFEPLPCPSWQVVVLDTGKAGSTRDLVAGVTARRPAIDPLLERIGRLVDQATSVLDDAEALGPLLDENHALLGAIGVSTPELDALCALARNAGALGAKLSGAGGGGVAIALVHDPAPVLAAAHAAGVTAWACRPLPA